MLSATGIRLTIVQLVDVVHGDRILRAAAACVVHLLRASPIVHALVRRGHGAYILESVYASIFSETLRD